MFDTGKSIFISSPAGSGKTESLARRYISLLKNNVPLERILAITFTDKASAEMKERILRILKQEEPEIYREVFEKSYRMRISTIHSFCLKLLKRFALDLDIDPSLNVCDDFISKILWDESIYSVLYSEDGQQIFKTLLSEFSEGVKNFGKVKELIDSLFYKRPLVDLILEDTLECDENELILSAFKFCLDEYNKRKKSLRIIDFADIELLAYKSITQNPEWANILFAFDEQTDHILVDEFQDTSRIQWMIIYKLTEEWRAGIGKKRAEGLKPTIFLVGDDKQSIYGFRGADVEVFSEAKEELKNWLQDEFQYIELEKNYRSVPEIVNFVNELFSKIMQGDLINRWKTNYIHFKPDRIAKGSVELLILEGELNTEQGRKYEAELIADKILTIKDKLKIHDCSGDRLCNFSDIAILLRSRTHLEKLEHALRKRKIPFTVVKGSGFFKTPEVNILKYLVFCLIEPEDEYSLCMVLSTVLKLSWEDIYELYKQKNNKNLWYVLSEKHKGIYSTINKWIETAKQKSFSSTIEEILTETKLWSYFAEPQRYMNAKKFISIIGEIESKGEPPLIMRERVLRLTEKDEAKANVDSYALDSVKILTIHAAKGLQFPVVFIPCLDEENRKTHKVIIHQKEGSFKISFSENEEIRKIQKQKDIEEEKRLFYVATTRAMDHLFMSGFIKNDEQLKGRLKFINDAFNLTENIHLPFNLKKISITSENDLNEILQNQDFMNEFDYTKKFSHSEYFIFPQKVPDLKCISWHDVTEEIEEIKRKHTLEWDAVGQVLHTTFDAISRSQVSLNEIEQFIESITKNEILLPEKQKQIQSLAIQEIEKLKKSPYFYKIIAPRENSFSEIPFIIEIEGKVYSGRIDRIIIENNIAHLYDYKTYPVSEKEIKKLKEAYIEQLNIYRLATEKLFRIQVKAYILFSYIPVIIEMN